MFGDLILLGETKKISTAPTLISARDSQSSLWVKCTIEDKILAPFRPYSNCYIVYQVYSDADKQYPAISYNMAASNPYAGTREYQCSGYFGPNKGRYVAISIRFMYSNGTADRYSDESDVVKIV